jgi:predicted ATPase/class 3 adenylate cyclase
VSDLGAAWFTDRLWSGCRGYTVAELPSGTVTFLFTDIEGSTRLWEEHPEAMKAALARHDELLRDAIEAQGGHVVKSTGDGVHAVFTTAHDALNAAISGQQVLQAESWNTTPIAVRMGVHTGETEHREGDYFGSALNRAARLMGVAHGGQIVVSQVTGGLVTDELPDGVSLVDLGEQRLRDLSRPERVFQLVAPGVRESFPPLRSVNAFPGNLPVQLTSFVGRDDDVAGVAKALTESRLVTLTGVGGVGKTRLAIQIAAELVPRFVDGVWLCELAATNDPDLLGQVLVAALGVQPRPGRSLAESVCDYLSGKQALIILDNCEHLLDAAAGIAEAILLAALGVRVLATSREPLGVAGERLLGVPSLRVASEPSLEAIAACEAVQLFMERAEATRPGLELDATNADQIVEICRRLDAIPLAIELAAARLTSMSPGDIAGLLDERFRLLTGGRRRGVERHHTLRATVEWSYSLLGERERTIFDRLGVFAGSFDADAATAVAGDDALAAWDVRDGLADLVAKSMIVLDDGPDASTRFRLLETLRQYALERLDDTGHTEHYRRSHAEHYATFAEGAGHGLEGPDEAAWVGRFDAERDNLRAAVAWALDAQPAGDSELGLRIIAALGGQSFSRPATGVGEWAEAALEQGETSTPGRRTAVFAAAAWKAVLEGDLELARARAANALRDGLPLDTPSPELAHGALLIAESWAGQHQAAYETHAAGQRTLDNIGASDYAHVSLLTAEVVARLSASQDTEARALAQDALRRARMLANPSLLIITLRWFASTRRPDESDEAIQALEECLAHSRAVATADHPDALQALGNLAPLRAHRGEHALALEALCESVIGAHDTGQAAITAILLSYGVSVAAELEAWEFAATLGAAVTDLERARFVPMSATERTDRQAALDQARTQLGCSRYDEAAATGNAMSHEELVEYTLSELDRLLAENKSLAGT